MNKQIPDINNPRNLQAGDTIYLPDADNGKKYEGKILKVETNGRTLVEWFDGTTDSYVHASALRKA